VNGPWRAHSASPQQDVAAGRPGWSRSGQGLPAGPAPRGCVLLVTFLAQARKVTRPPARTHVRRNRRQGGRKNPATVVPRCLKTGLRAVSPASSAALRTARSASGRAPFLARPRKGAKRRTPPQGRPPAAGPRAAGPFKGAALTRHPAAAKLNGPSLARSPPCPDPQPGGLEGEFLLLLALRQGMPPWGRPGRACGGRVNGPWKAHSALPQQDVASGRPGWSRPGQGLPAGPAPRGCVLLVTFLAQARKVTRPPAQAPARRNRRQGGRKPLSTVVQSRFETGLQAVSPASSAEGRDAVPLGAALDGPVEAG